jgi:Protein phosphatase 2C
MTGYIHDPSGSGPVNTTQAAETRSALRTERCDRDCQRFLPSQPPSKSAIRGYLANRITRTEVVSTSGSTQLDENAPAPTIIQADSIAVAASTPAPVHRASPSGAPPAGAPRGAVLRRRDGHADDQGAPPPNLTPPLGLKTWCTEPAERSDRRFGSHSHPGPPEVEVDKGNQDFAFHLELMAPDGAAWVLVGVADGVSQATWSSRAARHASAAFIEAITQSFAAPAFPSSATKLLRDDWPDMIAQSFHQHLRTRFEDDCQFLFEGRYIDPTYARALFRDQFWTGPDIHKNMAKEWFQTTLLAAALGPEGGFALFLGDGYARIERRHADGHVEISPGLDATSMISRGLTEPQVRRGIVRLPPKGATHLGVLLTTDGVSKSSPDGILEALRAATIPLEPGVGGPLDHASFGSSEVCRRFLETLAKSPLADRDNMSIAFAVRPLDTRGMP